MPKEHREPKEMILITQSLKELQQVMSDYVGIVRNDIRLQRAIRRLDLLMGRNRTTYIKQVLLSPQLLELTKYDHCWLPDCKRCKLPKRKPGLHYNTDYPGKSELVQNIVL